MQDAYQPFDLRRESANSVERLTHYPQARDTPPVNAPVVGASTRLQHFKLQGRSAAVELRSQMLRRYGNFD